MRLRYLALMNFGSFVIKLQIGIQIKEHENES
jgi:hypothetical protein